MLVEVTQSVRVLIKGEGRQQEAKASEQEVQRMSRGVGQGASRGKGRPWPVCMQPIGHTFPSGAHLPPQALLE